MGTAHEWIFPAAILNSIVLNSYYGMGKLIIMYLPL